MTRSVASLALAIALAATSTTSAAAATVRAFPLPAGFTVHPEGERRLVALAPDGTVAALSEDTANTGRVRALRWSRGVRSSFTPLPVSTAPDKGMTGPFGVAGVAAGPGVVYVMATEVFSGGYSGLSFEVQRWIGNAALRWKLPSCVRTSPETDQHANAVDAAGRIALTIDMTGNSSMLAMQDAPEQYAPYAFVIDGDACRPLGRAVVLGLRAGWAAGYRGYLNGRLAPTNLNVIIQRVIAVRWHGDRLIELGDGAAYAVTAKGFAVGASAVAGHFESVTTNFYGGQGGRYESAVPHALGWDAGGRVIALERGARRSVAYDVADDGTAVGMLQSADGKHYAFRWRAGRLQRLDDLPHLAGWRFESAYAIARDGTIAGTGTYNGIATVYTWHP